MKFAHSRAVRPFPFAKGWIRTHSACAQAHRSRTASSWSGVSFRPTVILRSNSATALRIIFSNCWSSSQSRKINSMALRPSSKIHSGIGSACPSRKTTDHNILVNRRIWRDPQLNLKKKLQNYSLNSSKKWARSRRKTIAVASQSPCIAFIPASA